MSIYSLKTLSEEGAIRISVELLLIFVIVTLLHILVIEPILLSTALTIYVQPGLDYTRWEMPDTASEITHLFLTVVFRGSFLFWRLNRTELGKTFKNVVMEGYKTGR